MSQANGEQPAATPTNPAAAPPLSPTVKALGAVSLCTDVSSEMVYPLNPIFLTQVLRAPAWAVGLIEGVAESVASILKLWSGWLSDRTGRRKPFTVAGYALSAVSKPLIALAGAWAWVLGARFLDRTGKGLRTAPRDALITESCAPEQRGRAFGFHRSMDTLGAVIGPLLGYLFLLRYPDQLRGLYLLAFIPGMLGVLVLGLFVRERKKARTPREVGEMGKRAPVFSFKQISPEYRRYLLIVALFSFGNSSDAFLLLRAQGMGVEVRHMLLLYALFNVVEAVLGYWAGGLSDRVGRRPLVAAGYLVFAVVYFGFAIFHSAVAAWILFPIYGLHYTLTQGTQRALAADLAHPDRRGAEIGAFHMVVGLAALPASVFAGWLYSRVSPSSPFFLGSFTAAAAGVLLLLSHRGSAGAQPRVPA
ncbi:MAG: MFS transporter [Verrucomicrobiota bacterium]